MQCKHFHFWNWWQTETLNFSRTRWLSFGVLPHWWSFDVTVDSIWTLQSKNLENGSLETCSEWKQSSNAQFGQCFCHHGTCNATLGFIDAPTPPGNLNFAWHSAEFENESKTLLVDSVSPFKVEHKHSLGMLQLNSHQKKDDLLQMPWTLILNKHSMWSIPECTCFDMKWTSHCLSLQSVESQFMLASKGQQAFPLLKCLVCAGPNNIAAEEAHLQSKSASFCVNWSPKTHLMWGNKETIFHWTNWTQTIGPQRFNFCQNNNLACQQALMHFFVSKTWMQQPVNHWSPQTAVWCCDWAMKGFVGRMAGDDNSVQQMTVQQNVEMHLT